MSTRTFFDAYCMLSKGMQSPAGILSHRLDSVRLLFLRYFLKKIKCFAILISAGPHGESSASKEILCRLDHIFIWSTEMHFWLKKRVL